MQLVKYVENRLSHYFVPLDKNIDDHPAFLDATVTISDAIRRDKRAGYLEEDGPFYAIERHRAEEYAKYVAEYASPRNYFMFSTRRYDVRLNPMSESQIAENRKSRR